MGKINHTIVDQPILKILIDNKNDIDSNNKNIDKIDVDQITDEESKNAVIALKKINLSGIDLEKLNDMKNDISDIKNDLGSFNTLNFDTTILKEGSVESSTNKELFVEGMKKQLVVVHY